MHSVYRNGFSLLEVLIAVFILCVGLLGVLALQLSTLHTAQDAHFETIALHLATEIAEQMRTATDSAEAMRQWQQLDYDSAAAQPDSRPILCYGDGRSCSPGQLAAFEIEQWKSRTRMQLPAGRLRICRDQTPWQADDKRPSWACSNHGNAPVWIKLGWQARHTDAPASSAPKLLLPVGALLD